MPSLVAPICEQLRGGDPRTLGNVDAVVELILARPDLTPELIGCVLSSDDEIVRMRASDALEKVCRARPSLLQPHVSLLLTKMARIDQPSVQWHVAQMLGHVKLSTRQRERATTVLCRNLDQSSDWIVLNLSLNTMGVLVRQAPQLVERLRGYLHRYEQSRYRSLSARARKLLAEFDGLTDKTDRDGPQRPAPGLLSVDPAPFLASSDNAAISFFARRDLLDMDVGPVSALWGLPEMRKIVARQNADGSWRYPGGNSRMRSREDYNQLETFRQAGILVERFGATREHPAIEHAARYLFSFQTEEGDFRGIYGNQYATTYVGAITEVLVKAGYADDPRIAKAFRWLLAMRQSDGGWAIPLRTVGIPFPEFVDVKRHPNPIAPDRSKPSSHLVTGMVLRAFAGHPHRRRSADIHRAGELLAARLYQKDRYGDRGDVGYWERVSFPFWFTDVVSALDTLSRLELSADTLTIRAALERLRTAQRSDGTFAFKLLKSKDGDLPWWICLAVCRSLKRWQDAALVAPVSFQIKNPNAEGSRRPKSRFGDP